MAPARREEAEAAIARSFRPIPDQLRGRSWAPAANRLAPYSHFLEPAAGSPYLLTVRFHGGGAG